MTTELQQLRVYMAAGGLVPQAFRWQGRTLRVLHVEIVGVARQRAALPAAHGSGRI